MMQKQDKHVSGGVVAASELEGESIESKRRLADGYGQSIKKTQDVQVLTHSPMGIRGDMNISNWSLNLWLSPLAKKSVDYRMRNFSNRDDHTSIFDSISFPGLAPEKYQACDYDPFHCVLHYDGCDLHVVPLVDEPGYLLWCEGEEALVVDLKSDKQDSVAEQSERIFSILHPDRGYAFEFAAVAAEGAGTFQHQRHTDRGRSVYARIELEPGQALYLGGELEIERPCEAMARLAARPLDDVLAENEKLVSDATSRSRITFRDKADWQRQFDLNQRVLFSAQDHGGWIPAAFRALYYLCWHFDGAITSAVMGQAGWPEYLERWTAFELLNPTETPGPVPGKFFGQLVTGKISKQEEWGWYCGVWSAFSYWVQTGSRKFGEGVYRENLLETMDWLERHSYDAERRAFRIYYAGEDPFEESYDFGFDEAVGKPMAQRAPSHDGKAIRTAYIFTANILMYSSYLMLSALIEGEESKQALKKALELEPFLRKCIKEGVSRYCIVEGGEELKDTDPPRWPPCAFFSPDDAWLPDILLHDPKGQTEDVRKGKERFAHHCFINLIMRDPALMAQDDFFDLMDIFLPQCQRAGKYLQMEGSVIEDVNCEDGSYHDNRPQIFATGLMQGTIVAQGVRRQPFGLAVRANDVMEKIENYGFQGQNLDFLYEGKGPRVQRVWMGERELKHCLQLPEKWLPGNPTIRVEMTHSESDRPVWMASSVRLLDVEEQGGAIVYRATVYGRNSVSFDKCPEAVSIQVAGRTVEPDIHEANGWCYVDFQGVGEATIELKKS